MMRERALKTVMLITGLLFVASIYPIVMYLWRPGNDPPGDTMMLSLYFAMGIFLLMSTRHPSEHRSLIVYAGWANVAHATVMAIMAVHPASDRTGLLVACAIFAPIGIALITLAPPKFAAQRASTAGAI